MGNYDKTCKILDSIERFSDNYCDEYFLCSEYWDTEKLEESWWKALKFFLRHSFVRRRSNKLSLEYYNFAICILEKYLQIKELKLDLSFREFIESKREEFESAKRDIMDLKNLTGKKNVIIVL